MLYLNLILVSTCSYRGFLLSTRSLLNFACRDETTVIKSSYVEDVVYYNGSDYGNECETLGQYMFSYLPNVEEHLYLGGSKDETLK